MTEMANALGDSFGVARYGHGAFGGVRQDLAGHLDGRAGQLQNKTERKREDVTLWLSTTMLMTIIKLVSS